MGLWMLFLALVCMGWVLVNGRGVCEIVGWFGGWSSLGDGLMVLVWGSIVGEGEAGLLDGSLCEGNWWNGKQVVRKKQWTLEW